MNNIKYYLLYGCDVSNQVYDAGDALSYDDRCLRSDTIILIAVNSKTNKAKIISLLRDICVDVKGHGKCKLNSLIVYFGPRKATKMISKLFKINVTKYIVINMENMIKLIDSIGGIDLDLSLDEISFINGWSDDTKYVSNYKGNIYQLEKEGINHLNGLQTLTHARNRWNSHTWARTKKQRNILIAIAKQIKNNTKPNQLVSLGLSMLKLVKTNFNVIDIIKCANLSRKIKIDEIETYSVPSSNTKSIKKDGMWRFEIDFNDASTFINKVINEEDVEDFVV